LMDLQLFYRDEPLGDAWRKDFASCPKVAIACGDITDATCDAIVSPANSFGFMDGGLDHAISERFGWDLQEAVQQEIRRLPERELLVGMALVVPTGDDRIRWLIAAPTMRVPMSFNIASSVNAYLAMKAVLVAANRTPAIKSIAIPGLCTGVGRMPAYVASNQMYVAYDEVALGNHPTFLDFGEAQKHQADLNPNGMIWDY
ncbi:MAG: macro domain-containing protein, partial [Planctomycetales bacterium]|nr:macro domain-containing protein [Planctomycetales bacterium]